VEIQGLIGYYKLQSAFLTHSECCCSYFASTEMAKKLNKDAF